MLPPQITCLENCTLLGFGWRELDRLAVAEPSLAVALLVAGGRALGPIIRRFISLGLNRVWLKSGDVAYRQARRQNVDTCFCFAFSWLLQIIQMVD